MPYSASIFSRNHKVIVLPNYYDSTVVPTKNDSGVKLCLKLLSIQNNYVYSTLLINDKQNILKRDCIYNIYMLF